MGSMKLVLVWNLIFGFVVNKDESKKEIDKIVPILNFPTPKNWKQSRSFFGSRRLAGLDYKKFGRNKGPLKRPLKGTFIRLGRGGCRKHSIRYAFCFGKHSYWDHRIKIYFLLRSLTSSKHLSLLQVSNSIET